MLTEFFVSFKRFELLFVFMFQFYSSEFSERRNAKAFLMEVGNTFLKSALKKT